MSRVGRLRYFVDFATVDNLTALQAECLFAVVGLSPILDTDAAPVRITRSDLDAAEALPGKVCRLVNRFVAQSTFEADSEPPAIPLDRCIALVNGADAGAIADHVRGLPTEAATGFMGVAAACLTELKANAPALTVDTLSGPVKVKPSLVATSRFKRLWNTCEDPMTVMSDFAAGTVSREQVAALAKIFPTIYELARRQVLVAVAAQRYKVKSFQLPPRKDRVLQTFLQTPVVDQRLAAEIQAIYGGPDLDKNGDAIEQQPPEQPGVAPEITAAKPSAAQELEGR